MWEHLPTFNPQWINQVFGEINIPDYESDLNVRIGKLQSCSLKQHNKIDLFDSRLQKANSMSCMGAFGKIKDILGIPLMPLMTIYDFFIKRA